MVCIDKKNQVIERIHCNIFNTTLTFEDKLKLLKQLIQRTNYFNQDTKAWIWLYGQVKYPGHVYPPEWCDPPGYGI